MREFLQQENCMDDQNLPEAGKKRKAKEIQIPHKTSSRWKTNETDTSSQQKDKELILGSSPPFDSNVNYYQEYWRIYFENNGMQEHLIKLNNDKNETLE